MTNLNCKEVKNFFKKMNIVKSSFGKIDACIRLNIDQPVDNAQLKLLGQTIANSMELKECLSSQEIDQIACCIFSQVDNQCEPTERGDAGNINFPLYPPTKSPIEIVRQFTYLLAIGATEFEFLNSKFSSILNNLAISVFKNGRISYNNNFRVQCKVSAIAMIGCDIHALTDLCAEHVGNGLFYRMNTLFVQEAVLSEFDEALTKKLTNYDEEKLSDKTVLSVKNEASSIGVKVKIVGKTIIVYDGFINKLNFSEYMQGFNVVNIIPFRTASEAVKLIANLSHICAVTIWGADQNQAQSLAVGLRNVSTIWINTFGDSYCTAPICSDEHIKPTVSGKKLSDSVMIKMRQLIAENDIKEPLKDLCAIDQPRIPADVNVLVRAVGPIGCVDLDCSSMDSTSALRLIVAALACGNRLEIGNSGDQTRQVAESLSEILPPGIIKLGSKEHRTRSIQVFDEDGKLVFYNNFNDFNNNCQPGYFTKYQFVWLPKTVPL